MVWDKDENRIGTISIYNVKNESAESGRLAIKGENPFQGIEAQLLIFRFAFDKLKLKYVSGYIFADNERAIRFNRQFGAKQYPVEVDENGREIVKFDIFSEEYKKADSRYSSILYRGMNS